MTGRASTYLRVRSLPAVPGPTKEKTWLHSVLSPRPLLADPSPRECCRPHASIPTLWQNLQLGSSVTVCSLLGQPHGTIRPPRGDRGVFVAVQSQLLFLTWLQRMLLAETPRDTMVSSEELPSFVGSFCWRFICGYCLPRRHCCSSFLSLGLQGCISHLWIRLSADCFPSSLLLTFSNIPRTQNVGRGMCQDWWRCWMDNSMAQSS